MHVRKLKITKKNHIKTYNPSSDSCRGLCDVPFGLTTKCSQQFVQKKLVALDPSGDRLVEVGQAHSHL